VAGGAGGFEDGLAVSKGTGWPSRRNCLVTFLPPRGSAGGRRDRPGGELAGFGEGGVEVEGRLEIQRHQPPLVGRAELLQGVDHRVRRGAAEAAVAGVLEQAVEPVDVGQVGLGAVAVGQLVHEALQQRGADPAGVQKPQLSWAKKWTKARATSKRSRVPSKIMKAPAVGTSS
jgi:hypothetical protein